MDGSTIRGPRSIQRQLGGAFDLAHGDMRVRLVHVRALQQVVTQKTLVVGDVPGHHLEQIVRAAGHAVALQHLRVTHHGLFELVQVATAMGRQLDVDEHGDAETQALVVEQGDLALDQPFFLHAIDPPPAGRLGQFDLFRHLGSREISIVLQQAENSPVDGAELVLHDFFQFVVIVGRIMRSIVAVTRK